MVLYSTILGHFRTPGPIAGSSGPTDIRIQLCTDGVVRGTYKGKGGSAAGFEGTSVDRGRGLRGFWHDAGAGITTGNRFECTAAITLVTETSIKGHYRLKGGGEETWEAERVGDVPRVDGRIAGFAFKSKEIFERVANPQWEKKAEEAKTLRREALASSLPRSGFDGALSYCPSPSVGAEYLAAHEIARKAREKEEAHAAATIARLEAEIATLEGLAAGGEGGAGAASPGGDGAASPKSTVLDDRAKTRLALAKRLLAGEKSGVKLRAERGAFVPGLGHFVPESSKHAEHLPDAYMTEFEIARRAQKEAAARPKKELEALEAKLPSLVAASTSAEGGEGVEAAKKKLKATQASIRALKATASFSERRDFVSTSASSTIDPAKFAAPHMPEVSYSALELERKLRRDEAERAEKHTKALAAEVAKLEAAAAAAAAAGGSGGSSPVTPSAAGAAAAAGGAGAPVVPFDDRAKARLAIAKKLLKGEKGGEKLRERGTFKPMTGMPTAVRCSSTVLCHPSNIRRALR